MSVTKEHFLLLKKINSILFTLGNGIPVIYNNYLIFSAEFFEPEKFNLFDLTLDDKFSVVITEKRAKSLGISAKDALYHKLLCKIDEISFLINNVELNKDIASNKLSDSEFDCGKIGIELMKLAKFLPMIIFAEINQEKKSELKNNFDILEISDDELKLYNEIKYNYVEEISKTKVTLRDAENANLIVFRDFPFFGKTHLAIIIGDYENFNNQNPPLVRIHSGCYTGDLLRSLQCDCYDQLHKTIEYMNESWRNDNKIGIIIYQAEDEGRAIGLANKIRTYNLQAKNCNTISANHAIGYEDDERDFTIAMKILQKLNVAECDLITNNPKKINLFAEYYIVVKNRISLKIKNNIYNMEYLNIKKEQMGHLFSE